ncbi:hypothetical protein HWV62_1611 [Athelia sp. TMB]|nr:hypothetical protein HWV62_1611 [Athelia sp. TMB]
MRLILQIGYSIDHGNQISLFFAVEAMTVMYWSRLSDQVGRRPVLTMGLFGLSLSMICFGLSKTFWALVVSRCLAGALNGNIGVMKSMMAEITDSTNIAQGITSFKDAAPRIPDFEPHRICAPAGIMVVWIHHRVMPVIGGALARPYDRFSLFHSAFWKEYPYFLPCAFSAAFSAFVCTLVIFLLKEPRKAARGPSAVESRIDQAEPAPAPLPFRALLTPPVVLTVSAYGLVAVLDMALRGLWPVFYSTALDYGGLGLPPPAVGLVMGSFGLANGLFQAAFFARIVARAGVRRVLLGGIAAFVPLFAMFPLVHAAARRGAWPVAWAGLALQFVFAISMDMSYGCSRAGCVFIYLSAAAPNKHSRGATNGLAQTVVSVVRAIGPAASTSLFAASVKHNLLGGYAVYLVLMVLSGLSLIVVARMPRELWTRD